MSGDHNMNQMQPCAGRNCGSTNPNLHSAECFEDYEKATGIAQPEHVHANDTSEKRVHKTAGKEHEPVAWHEPGAYGNVTVHKKWAKENGWLPLYTAPPQRKEWQGLTDEEIKTMWGSYFSRGLEYARAIEAKLREKSA